MRQFIIFHSKFLKLTAFNFHQSQRWASVQTMENRNIKTATKPSERVVKKRKRVWLQWIIDDSVLAGLVRSCCCLLIFIHAISFSPYLWYFMWVFSCFFWFFRINVDWTSAVCVPMSSSANNSTRPVWKIDWINYNFHDMRREATDDIAYISDDDRVSFSCRLSESSQRLYQRTIFH